MKSPLNRVQMAVTLLSAVQSLTAFASSGGEVGNGGFAYVCRDANKQITSAQLLDLWEVEDFETWQKNDPVQDQINAVVERLGHVSMNAKSVLTGIIKGMQNRIVFTSRALSKTTDAFPPFEPDAGCSYEQVARYETVLSETGRSGVRVNKEIYNSPHFSNSDRAALIVHEAIYLRDRNENGATNSQRVRTVVAHLFTDNVMPNGARMLLAGTSLGFDLIVDNEGTKKDRTILAVPNPLNYQVELQVREIDGIEFYKLDKLTEEQKSALYRCYVSAGGDVVDTGLFDISKLLGRPSKNPEEQTKVIKVVGSAQEFDPESYASTEMEEGSMLMNDVSVRCQREDKDGKITSVPVEVSVTFPDAMYLEILADGSIVNGREYWSIMRSKTYGDYHYANLAIEIVRGK